MSPRKKEGAIEQLFARQPVYEGQSGAAIASRAALPLPKTDFFNGLQEIFAQKLWI
jgi:hypothetical protein